MAVQTAKAHWLTRDTIAWRGAEPGCVFRLYYSPADDIAAQTPEGAPRGAFFPLSVDRNGLPQSIVEKFPFLKGATTTQDFRIGLGSCS